MTPRCDVSLWLNFVSQPLFVMTVEAANRLHFVNVGGVSARLRIEIKRFLARQGSVWAALVEFALDGRAKRIDRSLAVYDAPDWLAVNQR